MLNACRQHAEYSRTAQEMLRANSCHLSKQNLETPGKGSVIKHMEKESIRRKKGILQIVELHPNRKKKPNL